MQQQQPGTVTHSRISSLLISRRLASLRTRPSLLTAKGLVPRLMFD